jgi:phage-related protein
MRLSYSKKAILYGDAVVRRNPKRSGGRGAGEAARRHAGALRYVAQLIEEFGLERVREPHVKHVRGSLWEMRLRGKDGISRALYVTASRRRIVVVRVFVKKTETTPNREIELALKRAKEIPQ